MRYRTLGRTGLEVSEIGFGAWGIGGAQWLGAEDQDLLLRSFSASRFAAIPEPLLGYRQNMLSLRKSVRGRYYFSRSLLRAARSNGRMLHGLRAVGEQAVKLAWEWVAISSGVSRTLLRHRALPFTPEQAQAWRVVWAACHDASCAVPGKPLHSEG